MKCPKCGFIPQENSPPEEQCPKCGVINAKAIARPKALRTNRPSFTFSQRISQALIVFLVIFGIYAFIEDRITGNKQAGTVEKSTIADYEAYWHTEMNVGISRALAKNKITACGQYKYKQNSKHHGEYIVYCTPDGKLWIS